MARYCCSNCRYVVGAAVPGECPVCHTRAFEDLELLDNPDHPSKRAQRGRANVIQGLTLLAMGMSLSAALLLTQPHYALSGMFFAVFGLLVIVIGLRQQRLARKQADEDEATAKK